MARPQKDGLDYFPLDVTIDEDDKIAMIESEFGNEGFAIIIKLLMRIYGQHGYYTMMTSREQKLFAKRINVDINSLNIVIMLALSEHLFDSRLFEKYGVLTSKGIQKRYLEAVSRRKEITLIKEYLLIDTGNSEKVKLVNVYINPTQGELMQHDDVNNPGSDDVNVDKSTQSKVKESKVKESKELIHTQLSGYILKDTGQEMTVKEFNIYSSVPGFKNRILKKERT